MPAPGVVVQLRHEVEKVTVDGADRTADFAPNDDGSGRTCDVAYRSQRSRLPARPSLLRHFGHSVATQWLDRTRRSLTCRSSARLLPGNEATFELAPVQARLRLGV